MPVKPSLPTVFISIETETENNVNQEILYRYLKGDTTPQEDLQVAEWLEADPVANQKELDIVRFVFEGMELYGKRREGRTLRERG